MLNTHSNSMPKRNKLTHTTNKEGRRSLNDFNDAILKHILSFLSTKLAAQTSVLSKRWEYMWTSLPNLDLKDDSFIEIELGHTNTNEPKRQRFMNFVDRALILHISCIRKFSLRCQVNHDFSRIKTWISAVSRNVQEFEIDLYPGIDQPVFPFCLFNSATMEVLKIITHYNILQLPSHISLPCLKILTLQGVVTDCHPINLLFAGPALEQLVIYNCIWKGEYDVIISAPKLWKLSIDEFGESLDDELGTVSITISAPKLLTLVYKGSFFKEYRFHCPYSITNATLEFPDYMDSSEINKVHFDKVLRSLQSVECLALSPAFAWALSNSIVPKFRNLIDLDVFGGDIELTCTELARLVNKCPSLKSLRFLQRFSLKASYKFNDLLNLKFQYLPSTLKEFMIGRCSGEIEDISFLRILLSKLTSLETMKINFRWNPEVARREEIKSILSALHRGSKSCKLIMS